MSKRLRTLIALATMVMFVFSMAGLAGAQFSDVDNSDDYADDIELLAELEIAKGYEDGTFGVNKTMTRQEFAVFVIRAMKREALAEGFANYTTSFSDDAQIGSWARGHVYLATSLNIINGYPDGTFKPQGEVTHAEALTMLIRALGFKDYADKKGSWPAGYIVAADELGLTDGLTVVNNLPMVRSEMAIALVNTLNATTKKNDDGEPVDDPKSSWLAKQWKKDVSDAYVGVVERVSPSTNRVVVSGRTFKWDNATVFKVNGADEDPNGDPYTSAILDDDLDYDLEVEVTEDEEDEDIAAEINVLANSAWNAFLQAVETDEDETDYGQITIETAIDTYDVDIDEDTQIIIDGKKSTLAKLEEVFEDFQDEWNDNDAIVTVRIIGAYDEDEVDDLANLNATRVEVITDNIVEGEITAVGTDTDGSYARIGGKKVYHEGLNAVKDADVVWLLGSDNVARVALSESTGAVFFARVMEVEGDKVTLRLADGSERVISDAENETSAANLAALVGDVVWVEDKELYDADENGTEGGNVATKTSTYLTVGGTVVPLSPDGVIVKKADGKFGSYSDVKEGQVVDVYLTDKDEAGYIEIQ